MKMLTGKWSKDQFASGRFEEAIKRDTQRRASGGLKRMTAKNAATVLTAVLGLGAGWIAGKSLGGAISYSAPESSVSVEADPALTPPLQPASQPPMKGVSPGSQPQPDPTKPVVKPEPQQEAEKEQTDIPDYEQSTKEIGRQALKKMMKEIKRMNRNERQGKPGDGNANSP